MQLLIFFAFRENKILIFVEFQLRNNINIITLEQKSFDA